MSIGLKEKVNIAFIFQQSSGWMGGINYFKNLFIAMSKTENPKLIPYIMKPYDENSNILTKYSNLLDYNSKKNLRYYLKKWSRAIRGKEFDKRQFMQKTINFKEIDLISHSELRREKPVISWIPDFQHIHLKEMFDKKELISRDKGFLDKAKNSKIVILSSNDALNDFKAFAPRYAHKGKVLNFVAILEDDVYRKTDEIKTQTIEKLNLPEKYFYLPNQFWKHKNHKVVFEAVSILKEQGIDVQVVFSGSTNDYRHENHFNELMEFAKEKNIENNLKMVGLIDLIEVYYLMRNCISIINPSLFEGWSSTVEEAKSLGKNMILSNLNVYKEQNPPDSIYFNPMDANELAGILKEKWINGKSEPDYALEKEAQANIENRIANFGKQYQEIVLEALKKD